ncbi:MAG TPA: DUF4388 domain-containing protein [Kofleriaceae bacterium]
MLVVADPERVGELVTVLAELPDVAVLVSTGGDDTIDLFAERKPPVVVMTASLQVGDARSLVHALRAMVPRAEVSIVVVGDEDGPIRTALDALDLAPDRFVTRPLAARALQFAVTGGMETVRIVRGGAPPIPRPLAIAQGKRGEASATVRLVPPVPALRPVVPAATSDDAAATRAASDEAAATRAAMRARWEALADAIYEDGVAEHLDEAALADLSEPAARAEPAPAHPAIVIKPRRQKTAELDVMAEPDVDPVPLPVAAPDPEPPTREPTLIISDAGRDRGRDAVPPARTRTGDQHVVVAARTSSQEIWSEPMSIQAMAEREPREEPRPALIDVDALVLERQARAGARDEAFVRPAAFERPSTQVHASSSKSSPILRPPALTAAAELAAEVLDDDFGEDFAGAFDERLDADEPDVEPEIQPDAGGPPPPRDFARELRAKMTVMAQRLFQGDAPAASADHAPRHGHETEFDLASIGDDQELGGSAELEGRADRRHELREVRESMTSPGSWDSQVRERGLPDAGTIMRGVSDAAMLLAKLFAQGTTGRVTFRRDAGDGPDAQAVEVVVSFDHGRPVFALSNEPRDRMGALLVREGKITASQYERCQTVVAQSGRRMGEILVDFGYLKRRELLPAVRRHVEDIVYSLFAWERGSYAITVDGQPTAERIRLSRHPAALILEGIRRKLDRPVLERLLGPPSTVVEVRDRDRLGGIVNQGDLAGEERAALAAFDGQADLAQVARTAGIELADVLPLAWGLCVLGLASARRADAELAADESTALVGETDLAIDRERVRARWQLVTDADYFALLGVRRDATAFEIRRSYQAARRDFAADCFPSDLRRELARELDDIAHVLDEAFRVLRDDRLRQTYLANLVDR